MEYDSEIKQQEMLITCKTRMDLTHFTLSDGWRTKDHPLYDLVLENKTQKSQNYVDFKWISGYLGYEWQ